MSRILLSRRDMVKAAGLGLCLPFLEATASPNKKPPKRVVFIGYGYGHHEKDWFPAAPDKTGPFELSPSLKGLESCRKDVSFISHLSPTKARWAHDGCTTLLTCADTDADPLQKYSNTVSVDQVIANAIGHQSRIHSLQLNGTDKDVDGWGSGLSMSCGVNGSSIPGLSSLSAIYGRAFGDPLMSLDQRRASLNKQGRLLSLSSMDTSSLDKIISLEDKVKLSQFKEAAFAIEKRIKKDIEWTHQPLPKTSMEKPSSEGLSATDKNKAYFDLITEILRTDSTRVITYRMSSVGLLREMGHQQSTHSMSHWNRDPLDEKCQKDRDKKIVELFAGFLNQLKSVKESDGSSLLDNTLVYFGTGIRVFHDIRNIPMMVAGGGGVGLNQGKHFSYTKDKTPLGNLWLSTLRHFGIEQDTFGDSNGYADEIFRA